MVVMLPAGLAWLWSSECKAHGFVCHLGGRRAEGRTSGKDSPWGPGLLLSVCPWGALHAIGTGRPGTYFKW